MTTTRTTKLATHLKILIGALAGAALAAAWSPAAAQAPLLFPDQALRIALDPGHGGKDTGARGPTGLLEKEVCLALARDLALSLESRYAVVLTRSDDYQVELRQRTAIANQADAHMLISLHAGAAFVHAARGISIYYYADTGRDTPAGDPDRRIPADDPRQWEQAQKRHQPASLSLATALKKRMDQIPGIPECSIRGAPLAVLAGADMPAVLIEIGRITHPATEKRLAALQDQQWLTAPIVDSIRDFLGQRKAPR
jgi:N-acetylmuramoyl-L-alanine amidase